MALSQDRAEAAEETCTQQSVGLISNMTLHNYVMFHKGNYAPMKSVITSLIIHIALSGVTHLRGPARSGGKINFQQFYTFGHGAERNMCSYIANIMPFYTFWHERKRSSLFFGGGCRVCGKPVIVLF